MTGAQAVFGAHTPRLVGSAGEARGGPLLIATAAIHGNEPAGVHALRRVFAALEELRPRLLGRFVGLIGNRGALLAGQRYLESDMNRLWSRRKLAELAAGDPAADTAEQKEQRQLLSAIDAELAEPHGEVVHIDLHSTSGDSPPFLVQNGDARSLALGRAIGVPLLHGLLRNIDGTTLDLGLAKGFTSVVLEGGQNEAETTVEHHEAGLWLLLAELGVVSAEPRLELELERQRARIARSTSGIPPAVEICLRYAIEPQEHFTMLPGFKSFEHVIQGQLLALGGPSGRREIRSPMGGLLIMPRYQGQGADGFFLARPAPRVA
jgi:predicted deacylase